MDTVQTDTTTRAPEVLKIAFDCTIASSPKSLLGAQCHHKQNRELQWQDIEFVSFADDHHTDWEESLTDWTIADYKAFLLCCILLSNLYPYQRNDQPVRDIDFNARKESK